MQIISTIVSKKYISEMDLLRLQKANADSTYLVDKRASSVGTQDADPRGCESSSGAVLPEHRPLAPLRLEFHGHQIPWAGDFV
jgi:hypothetical protein